MQAKRTLENDKVKMDDICVEDAQTVGVQTKVAYSLPIAQNNVVNLTVYFMAVNSAFTLARSGYIMGTFLRATGIPALQSVPITDATGALGAVINLQANTSTNSMEVSITGVLATTINWRFTIYPIIYK